MTNIWEVIFKIFLNLKHLKCYMEKNDKFTEQRFLEKLILFFCYNSKNNKCRDLKMFTKYLFKQLLNVMQFSHYFGSFWDIYRHLIYLNI